MPTSRSTGILEEQVPESLQGLIVLKSTRKMKTGATRSIMLAARPLRELGIHLHFVSSRSHLHFLSSFLQTNHYRYDFAIFNGLASLLGRSHFGSILWRMVHALRIPTFIYWHEADWVLERLRREDPAGARKVSRIASHPSVVHLSASNNCSESICKHYPNAQPITVYECSSVPAPFDQPARPANPPTVVNIASVQERKGTDLFVETANQVCQRHQTVEFIWLGNGRSFGTWQADIQAAGLQHRILFPGYVDSAYLLLRRASIFFLSSRDDPFPLSILEAMCLGRTIVTFDVGGAPEALAGHGITIRPFDTGAAADAILGCLSRPSEQLLDQSVRCRYLDLYTPQKFAGRLNDCLRRQLAHGS